jgi:hypothetical protein
MVRPNNHHFYFNRQFINRIGDQKAAMWKNGVEYDMGVSLCMIYMQLSEFYIIPIEVIQLIYGIAKQIKKQFNY